METLRSLRGKISEVKTYRSKGIGMEWGLAKMLQLFDWERPSFFARFDDFRHFCAVHFIGVFEIQHSMLQ